MHVEDYMNETPACLLAMLTQTREDLWRRRQKRNDKRGVTRIILTGSGTSYHGVADCLARLCSSGAGYLLMSTASFLLDDRR